MEKIKKLKKLLKKEKIDGYLIPKNDEFFGEYVSKQNDRLKYITNFSGSFGLSLVLMNKNYLFVDGRYTLQAINQSGKNFKILTLPKKMPFNVVKDKKLLIGYDPKIFTRKNLNIFFGKKTYLLKPLNNNLIDKIWKRKLQKNKYNFYTLPNQSVGSSYSSKIKSVLTNLKKNNADFQLITASENCAWLLNIRGKDSRYSPIPNCYILIDKFENIKFFCNLKKLSLSFKKSFKKIEFLEIKLIEKVLSKIQKKKFILDQNSCSYYLEKIILRNNKIF